MSIFDKLDFGGLQTVLYPLVESLGGPDIRGEIVEKSAVFFEAADVLDACSALLLMAGEAASDGIMTTEEINDIVSAAPTVQAAVENLFVAIRGAEESV